jgi:DNA-binding HxlR family transcriptional regulator
MKRKQQEYSCGLEAALDVIGGRWKVLILWQLHPLARRFGELKRLVAGITEKMLIQQLRQMEIDGIVARRMFYQVPPRVEYSLTPFGLSLQQVLSPLCEWGTIHMERIGAKKKQCETAADKSVAAAANN